MFVEARTRPVLAEVCRQLDLPEAEAVLLRHHTNAVYAVSDVVVKIAPPEFGLDRARTVVTVAQWLAARQFPTVHLSPRLPQQPLAIGEHAVTVWQRLDPALDKPITTAELGVLLREMHSLPAPPVDLPALQPFESVQRSVARSSILDDADRDFLLKRLESLHAAWSMMTFPLGQSLIQSDPQTRNALRRFDGAPVLSDWDGAALGPREWDIATVAVHCRRFARPGSTSFADFTSAYGWDPATWVEFEDLCKLRELQMIATNARKSRQGTRAAAEVHRRIAGLHEEGQDLQSWQIL
ncbi:phosphotransferase [Micromonospora sp. NPDC049559]|uniref:phosphotransferase n=1 Tax=Micromonospora sp. NPDC049559 TaxID=3155923 RepID=UPI00342CBC51